MYVLGVCAGGKPGSVRLGVRGVYKEMYGYTNISDSVVPDENECGLQHRCNLWFYHATVVHRLQHTSHSACWQLL